MRIAYVAHWDVGRESGVLKKMAMQTRLWQEKGQDVRLFALSKSPGIWEGFGSIPTHVVARGNILARQGNWSDLANAVLAWKPDVCYMRFTTFYPALGRMLRKVPTIFEINSDDLLEYRLRLSRSRYRYHRTTRGLILRRARGLVVVGEQLARNFRRFDKPVIVISNGIDLREYQVLPVSTSATPRLAFMGYGQAWDGVDKVHRLAEAFPKWRFELVGPPAPPSVPANIRYHGVLRQSEYKQILTHCHIGIGPLALHRKGMNETSALKTTEYLAYGLPTIVGYRETDFAEATPFLLEIPNTEDNIERCAPQIADWVKQWKHRRVLHSQIAHIDATNKEDKRLAFFHTIL